MSNVLIDCPSCGDCGPLKVAKTTYPEHEPLPVKEWTVHCMICMASENYIDIAYGSYGKFLETLGGVEDSREE